MKRFALALLILCSCSKKPDYHGSKSNLASQAPWDPPKTNLPNYRYLVNARDLKEIALERQTMFTDYQNGLTEGRDQGIDAALAALELLEMEIQFRQTNFTFAEKSKIVREWVHLPTNLVNPHDNRPYYLQRQKDDALRLLQDMLDELKKKEAK